MALTFSRLVSGAAIATALGLTATPVAAADAQPGAADFALQYSAGAKGAERIASDDPWTRRYRHRHRHHRRHYRRGIDVGDVVTGVLILGALATIIDAADGDDDYRRRERDRDWDRDEDWRDDVRRDDDWRDDARRSDNRDGGYESDGISTAVDMCLDQVERGETRVEEVTDASRVADGWRVSGTLTRGWGWSCWIDNDGRIRNIDFDAGSLAVDQSAYGQVSFAAPALGQWSDTDYARARAAARTPVDEGYTYRRDDAPRVSDVAEGPQPAYPGGLLPGDDGYGDLDADLD